MGAPIAYQMPPPMMAAEPPEAQSIKSLLHIARILALIFGIILIIAGAVLLLFIVGIIPLIFGIINIVIYIQMKEIAAMVDQHQYEQAKSKTLVWMILGFILGGILIGILLLIAYLKFDPVITWQRNQQQGGVPPMGYAPQYAAPPPQYAAPVAPMAAPPPSAPPPAAAPAAPFCVKCGKPTTYIAQYGRYYCYADNLYV
ncbi:MAG: hypothetical protein WBW47_01830 [Thermoplasmata archaeon]